MQVRLKILTAPPPPAGVLYRTMKDTENNMCLNVDVYMQSDIKNKFHVVEWDLNLVLTGDSEAGATLL